MKKGKIGFEPLTRQDLKIGKGFDGNTSVGHEPAYTHY